MLSSSRMLRRSSIVKLIMLGMLTFGCIYMNLFWNLTRSSYHPGDFPGQSQTPPYRPQLSVNETLKQLMSISPKYSNMTIQSNTAVSTRSLERIPRNTRAFKSSSSVDHFSCCGAGHRLSKLVDAHYLAKRYLKFGLRVFFGFCGKQELYSWLFQGPQPVDYPIVSELTQIKVQNDVPGFDRVTRRGPTAPCVCPMDRWHEDATFYFNLRNRFRGKSVVDDFVTHQLLNDTHMIIGMHVRAGNGEVGDFTRKNRTISDDHQWAASMTKKLIQLSQGRNQKPAILFLATDTPSMVSIFQDLLRKHMRVVTWSQTRPNQGAGVLFGENFHTRNFHSTNGNEGESGCLEGWESAFTDMMILSHADVVVAARPSSFTQSLPMTLVLMTPKHNRQKQHNYCEVDPAAREMQCYADLQDWCCNGTTSFSMQGIQKYEYRRMPNEAYLQSEEMRSKIQPRSFLERECIPTPRNPQRNCLPYIMPDRDQVEEAGRMVF